MTNKTLGLFGCGSLAGIIVSAVKDGYLEGYTLIGATDLLPGTAEKLAVKAGCEACGGLDELLSLHPDYVIETAAPDALKEAGEKILRAGSDLIALSVGALADKDFYAALEKTAAETRRKVYLPSGAIGGLDVMRTAQLMGPVTCSVINEKAPGALNGAPFLKGRILPGDKEEEVFVGSAAEAIGLFPKNVNVAVAAALATAGVDKTKVVVRSVPGMEVNRHRVELKGEEVSAVLTIDSKPSRENPKSSSMAAWSVIMLLKKLSSPIVMG